jgi:hypothetical protein
VLHPGADIVAPELDRLGLHQITRFEHRATTALLRHSKSNEARYRKTELRRLLAVQSHPNIPYGDGESPDLRFLLYENIDYENIDYENIDGGRSAAANRPEPRPSPRARIQLPDAEAWNRCALDPSLGPVSLETAPAGEDRR